MASDPITGFQRRYMSFGDMLGEWFYGFLMVAVVCGIIGGYSDILLASNLGYGRIYLTVVLVVLTFRGEHHVGDHRRYYRYIRESDR